LGQGGKDVQFVAALSPGFNNFTDLLTPAISAIAPPFLVYSLHRASFLHRGSKILLVSSESGSITLRHPKEGGGNYAHHGSKAALNMVGKLLGMDLRDHDVIVSIVHPGFMRTDMTRGVGFDKYWDDGGAVTPDEAAASLVKWTEDLTIDKSGEYWAPRGPSMYSFLSFFGDARGLHADGLGRRYWHRRASSWQGPTDAIASALVRAVCM
jgi:NAD(P)-dependent dehydrogenase (short-subunit alcohol dehydrogenase family)